MKVADVDGHTDEREVAAIKHYFVRQWGYSEKFVDRGLGFVDQKLDDYHIKTTAATLGAFARDNPDCKANVMLADITSFLREVMEADGRVDEREEMAIERVEKVFAEEMRFSLSRSVAPVGSAASKIVGSAGSTAAGVGKRASQLIGSAGSGLASTVRKPWKRDEDQ